jgi:CheY-like chemotaxis protein
VLEHIRDEQSLGDLPVVVFTGRELSAEEDARLHTLARSVVVKGVESPERLLDETALFLHRVVTDLPPAKQALLERLHRSDDDLVGRKVLVVDDDVRNLFALSSVSSGAACRCSTPAPDTSDRAVGEIPRCGHSIDGRHDARDGRLPDDAGDRLRPRFRRLPIVALTAKAMKGDRERCLDAGASDYLAKPVNTEQLLSALRLWLHR